MPSAATLRGRLRAGSAVYSGAGAAGAVDSTGLSSGTGGTGAVTGAVGSSQGRGADSVTGGSSGGGGSSSSAGAGDSGISGTAAFGSAAGAGAGSFSTAGAATGSTGDGYALAHALGHTIEPVRPSLVPLETSMPDREFLYGLHLRNISAKLLLDGTAVAEEFGEMSFSPRGVEGAVVLRMSRTAVDALIEGHRVELSVDLKPALDEATLRERIGRETGELGPEAPMADLLRRLVPKELVMPIAKAVGGHPKRLLRQAAPEMAETLIRTLKDFRIPVSDYRPFEEAIVTAGGITVSEVNPATMESRLVRGLYFAGEVLDLDANTGGYNLQIAFSTGRLAGRLKHEE